MSCSTNATQYASTDDMSLQITTVAMTTRFRVSSPKESATKSVYLFNQFTFLKQRVMSFLKGSKQPIGLGLAINDRDAAGKAAAASTRLSSNAQSYLSSLKRSTAQLRDADANRRPAAAVSTPKKSTPSVITKPTVATPSWQSVDDIKTPSFDDDSFISTESISKKPPTKEADVSRKTKAAFAFKTVPDSPNGSSLSSVLNILSLEDLGDNVAGTTNTLQYDVPAKPAAKAESVDVGIINRRSSLFLKPSSDSADESETTIRTATDSNTPTAADKTLRSTAETQSSSTIEESSYESDFESDSSNDSEENPQRTASSKSPSKYESSSENSVVSVKPPLRRRRSSPHRRQRRLSKTVQTDRWWKTQPQVIPTAQLRLIERMNLDGYEQLTAVHSPIRTLLYSVLSSQLNMIRSFAEGQREIYDRWKEITLSSVENAEQTFQ